MQDKPIARNRRKAQRQNVAFTLTYGVKKPYTLRVNLGLADDITALMLDLSDSGMAVTTGFNLPQGTQLQLKFNFINLFLTGQERCRRMEIEAEVVSCANLGKENYRIGICFNNISSREEGEKRVLESNM